MEIFNKFGVILLLIQAGLFTARCYKNGAPAGTCLTMYPHHGPAVHQTSEPPFNITLSKATYSPSEEITVVIGSQDNTMFKGIELKAHRLIGNTEVLEGQFTAFDTDKLKTHDCFGGTENLITHKNENNVTSLNITWRAPAENIGDIQITATIVYNFTVFWFNVKAVIQSESTVNVTDPLFQIPQIKAASSTLIFSECGASQGCLIHPKSCTGSDCSAVATFTDNDDGTLTFQLVGPIIDGAGYVAIALSKDRKMGLDEVFLCSIGSDSVTVQHSYNPSYYTVQDYTSGFLNVHTRNSDGKIYCRFTRNKNSTLYQEAGLNFDLNEAYYLQLAWGGTYSNTGQARKHKDLPVTTRTMVLFNQYDVHTVDGVISEAGRMIVDSCLFITLSVCLIILKVQ